MSYSKENFEDYQEGGVLGLGESFFGKKKPAPAPAPPDPYAGAPFQERPTDAARRRAEEEARRKAQEERERAEAERRKKYGPGPLSSTAMGRGTVDFARAVAAKTTTAAAVAKNTAALVIPKPKLRDINMLDADMLNDNNTPITPTDFTITYNNLMEEIKNIITLDDMQKGEKVLKELKILRSLVGESFTNTEKCITEIFDKLASFNEKVLLGTFDINEKDTLKNEMYAISDRHFNDNTIINLIMDYVDKNYANINKFNLSGFYLLKSNKGISNFYMKMLTIIFYPKIILDMISDKMIDSIIAIKEKRDDLLADGDDNINSIIERLFGKSSSDYRDNYDSIRNMSFRTLSSGSSARTDDTDFSLDLESSRTDDSDDSVRPPGLETAHTGGAPPVLQAHFKSAMRTLRPAAPAVVAVAAAPADPGGAAVADPGGAAVADPGGAAVAAPADGAAAPAAAAAAGGGGVAATSLGLAIAGACRERAVASRKPSRTAAIPCR
jgi:hypothetical protein